MANYIGTKTVCYNQLFGVYDNVNWCRHMPIDDSTFLMDCNGILYNGHPKYLDVEQNNTIHIE